LRVTAIWAARCSFSFYDTPKVLLLLTGVVFVMGMVNSYFTPERTRALLAGRTEGVANVMAASLGIVTPFCSCSAVPLFIGFVQAGVPLGVTFSFLISSPLVDLASVILLASIFNWRIAIAYVVVGLVLAVAGARSSAHSSSSDTWSRSSTARTFPRPSCPRSG